MFDRGHSHRVGISLERWKILSGVGFSPARTYFRFPGLGQASSCALIKSRRLCVSEPMGLNTLAGTAMSTRVLLVDGGPSTPNVDIQQSLKLNADEEDPEKPSLAAAVLAYCLCGTGVRRT